MGPLASAKGEEDAHARVRWQYKSVLSRLLKLPVAGSMPPMSQVTYDELQEKKYDAHPIVRQIIDRDCHVSLSNRAVVEHVISKLGQAFKSMPLTDRHWLFRQCIDIHRANRAEYHAVMHPSYSESDE